MRKPDLNLSIFAITCFAFLFMFSSCVSTQKPDPVRDEWMQKYPLDDITETYSTEKNPDELLAEIKEWIYKNYNQVNENGSQKKLVISYKIIDKEKVLCTVVDKTKYYGDLSYTVLFNAQKEKLILSFKDALLYAKCATSYDVPMTFDISMRHSEGFTKPEWEQFRKNGSELYQKEINRLKDAVKKIAGK